MHTDSFYKGLLEELQKQATVVQKKKPSFWHSAIPAALLGAGLGVGGYYGYKALNAPKPASPAPTVQTRPPTPLEIKEPYQFGDLKNQPTPKTTIFDIPVVADSMITSPGLAAGLAKSVTGKFPNTFPTFNKGFDFVEKGLSRYYNHPLLPSATRNILPAFKGLSLTPLKAVLGMYNAGHALREGAGIPETALPLLLSALPGGFATNTAAGAAEFALDDAGNIQNNWLNSKFDIANFINQAHHIYHNRDVPDVLKQQATQQLNDPAVMKQIESTLHPGAFTRGAWNLWGLGGAKPVNDATINLLQRVKDEAAQYQQASGYGE